MNSRLKLQSAAILILAAAATAIAGPINPPAGPVTSTMKTLVEVEPRIAINFLNTPAGGGAQYRITEPGSYYLTSNLQVANIQHGIQIDLNTDGLVTIDLNGFSIIGREDTLNGIDVDAPFTPRVVIRNGFVTMFGGNGIDMTGTENATIENVQSTRNGGKGFIIDAGSLADCKAQYNSTGGFKVGDGASLTACEAVTTGLGIEAGTECRLVDCTVKGSNTHGIRAANNAVLTRCIAMNNTGTGIYVDLGCTVRDCVGAENGSAGISTNQLCTITGCTARSNSQWGITAVNSTLEGCSTRDNTLAGFSVSYCMVRGCASNANGDVGYGLGAHSTLIDSSAQGNTAAGAYGGGNCHIVNCHFSYNYGHGISLVSDDNLVKGNHCVGNGNGPGGAQSGAGIHVSGSDSRIEDNQCSDGDWGIYVVTGQRNVIVSNSSSGNTLNWNIGPNNSYGPVIDRSAPVNAGFTGNAAATQLGTTDPNANFTN